jgi:large subunit ribosomal protein L7Ae
MTQKIYEFVEKAAKTGKIDRGINEVTKSLERGVAKAVVIASDVSPKELTQHLPILAKEKNIKFFEVESKEKLGISSGISVSTGAVAIINEGEANLASLN